MTLIIVLVCPPANICIDLMSSPTARAEMDCSTSQCGLPHRRKQGFNETRKYPAGRTNHEASLSLYVMINIIWRIFGKFRPPFFGPESRFLGVETFFHIIV